MSNSCQALCFLAGANSIFTGERLLTTPNASASKDDALPGALGINKRTPPLAGYTGLAAE